MDPIGTLRAIVGERVEDGKVLGLGGVYRTIWPGNVIFRMVPEAVNYPFVLHRCAYQLLDLARSEGHQSVYAIQDIYASTSERWLKRLGFEFVGMEARGPRWERSL